MEKYKELKGNYLREVERKGRTVVKCCEKIVFREF